MVSVPGSAAVDVSSIPSGLFERVEVLTGGASAVALPGVEIENAQNFTPAFAEEGWIHDASIRWEARENLDLTFGVNNLTNREPFTGSSVAPVSGVGRFFFLRLSASL